MPHRHEQAPRPARVAYVMTNYPYPSQTFLIEEILGVEGAQFEILPIAINAATDADILTDEHRRENARTFYVKTMAKGKIAAIVARWWLRHPVAMTRLAVGAARTAGLDLKLMAWRVFHFIEGLLVWDHCRRHGVRHLHAQFGGLPAAVAMYAAEIGRDVDNADIGWSYTVHGFHDFVNESEIRLDIKTHAASFVVGISDYTTSQLMRIADPADWPKISVVRCGIDLTRFSLRPPRVPSAAPVVVTVGRLSAEKGHIVLLQALRQLADEGFPLQLRLIGSGPYQTEIEQEINRLDLNDSVTLLGMRPSTEVADELLNADVFCLPSFAEGVPVSIMEAMAIGVPVVSTNVGGIPELLTNGVTGWCVAPGRSDQLAAALRDAATAGSDLDAVRRHARERIEELHDNRTMARAMRQLFATQLGLVTEVAPANN